MAPELFYMESSMRTIEDQKVDIWALGIIAFEMFFGRKPFEEKISNMRKKREYYINLREVNNNISKEFVEFLNLCLQENPKERAGAHELFETDFYNLCYQDISKLDHTGLLSSLGTHEDNLNRIILRTDKKYYTKKGEDEDDY